MPYAQINYKETLGTGAEAVTIAAAGCFVTADSNLLERFGQTVDPANLNQWFIDHGLYIVESDGTKDLLSWGSITAFMPEVRLVSSGNVINGDTSAITDNAIVKFIYNGGITHFCLVASAANHTIVDSYDGKTKSWNVYGGPVAYANYTNAAATPTTTAKPVQKYAVVETYAEGKKIRLNKQPTNLWGMNYAFEYMKDHPVEVHNQGEEWVVVDKVHHEDGYDYYRREGQIDGFNVADCDEVAPEPAASIVYTELDQPIYLVAKLQPTSAWNLGFKDYSSAVAERTFNQGDPFVAVGKAQRVDYEGQPVYFLDADMMAHARIDGTPSTNTGVNTMDLAPAPAPTADAAVPTTPLLSTSPPMSPITPVAPPSDDSWKKTYINKARYTSKVDQDVHDIITGALIGNQLVKGQSVNTAARYQKDGVWYVVTQKALDAGLFYDIKLDDLKLVQEFDIEDDDDTVFDEVMHVAENVEHAVEAVAHKVKTDTDLRTKLVNFVAKHHSK